MNRRRFHCLWLKYCYELWKYTSQAVPLFKRDTYCCVWTHGSSLLKAWRPGWEMCDWAHRSESNSPGNQQRERTWVTELNRIHVFLKSKEIPTNFTTLRKAILTTNYLLERLLGIMKATIKAVIKAKGSDSSKTNHTCFVYIFFLYYIIVILWLFWHWLPEWMLSDLHNRYK